MPTKRGWPRDMSPVNPAIMFQHTASVPKKQVRMKMSMK